MALNFYDVYINNLAETPKERYLNDMDAVIDRQFQNASDWDTVQEEDSIGAGTYTDLIVRLNKVFDPRAGIKLGDEYRKIIYKDRQTTEKLGLYYQYDSRYWIGFNPDFINLPTSSNIIVRCNDTFRWYDEDGVYREYPVYIDATDTGMGLEEDKYMALTKGRLQSYVQFNEHTAKLLEGQEFLLGREGKRAKYRISFEDDFETDAILKLKLSRYQLNKDVDNTTLGIANYTERPQFTLNVEQAIAEISIGNTIQLEATLLDKDGQESDKPIAWSSSDEDIATVDSNGLVTAIDNGSVTITAEMTNNTNVNDTSDILVTATPASTIEYVISPDLDSLLRTQDENFVVQKLDNGVVQAETFTISVDGSTTASSDEYSFEVLSSTSFNLECIKEGNSVSILIVPDADVGNSFVKTFELKGYW